MTAWQPSQVLKTVQHAVPLSRTATLTPSTGVDCKGYEWLRVIIDAGTFADSTVFQLQESSVEDGTGDAFANITGATLAAPVTSANDNAQHYIEVYLQPRERYIRCLCTQTGSSGSVYGVTFELFHPDRKEWLTDTHVTVTGNT